MNIEQKENSIGESKGIYVGEDAIETRLLTAPDVARILNISKGAAYQLIQQKKIRSIHINSSVRVNQEDLDEFIKNNRE